MRPGDVLETAIAGVGLLRNRIAEPPAWIRSAS